MLLIDADTLCYVAAVMAEGLDESEARINVDKYLEDLLIDCNDFDYICYLTGDNNFRYKIYPEYKANRKDQPKPTYLPIARERLITSYNAIVSDGCEADDLVGIEHYKRGCEPTIVSVDKDLDQYVGWHYNPKKKIRYLVSPNDAIRFFYYQMLVGDTADNVKGVAGIGPKKAERALANCETEEEMFDTVRDLYGNDEEMLMNGRVLWLWQKENDIWIPMKELNGNQTTVE